MNATNSTANVPVIDYRNHPAFVAAGSGKSGSEDAIDEQLKEIDREADRILSESKSSREELLRRYEHSMPPRFKALSASVIQFAGLERPIREFVESAIDRACEFLLEDLQARFITINSKRQESGKNATAAERLQSFQTDGFCRIGIYPSLAKEIWSKTWWERSQLRARSKSDPWRHCALALQRYSPGADAICNFLVTEGVIELASAYMGQQMEFIYAALDHAHERQSWYKNCYSDIGLPTSKTAYMHFDADHDVIKAMLYLRDVGPENGPFRFVRGSHKWNRSAVVTAISRGFDVEQEARFEAEADGLDYKLGYYRPRYKVNEYREALAKLPNLLRGSTHFGDDIVDGSVLSTQLLSQEEVFVGSAGILVIFDGSRGIHRGSLVESGSRWAVQIGMRVSKSAPRGPLATALGAVRGKLGYQLRRARNLSGTLWER
jgi:Phytanoyl-CoA dioxygenase (PhyH)